MQIYLVYNITYGYIINTLSMLEASKVLIKEKKMLQVVLYAKN